MMTAPGEQVERLDPEFGEQSADRRDDVALHEEAALGIDQRLPGRVEVHVLDVEVDEERVPVPERTRDLELAREHRRQVGHRTKARRRVGRRRGRREELRRRALEAPSAEILLVPAPHRRMGIETPPLRRRPAPAVRPRRRRTASRRPEHRSQRGHWHHWGLRVDLRQREQRSDLGARRAGGHALKVLPAATPGTTRSGGAS